MLLLWRIVFRGMLGLEFFRSFTLVVLRLVLSIEGFSFVFIFVVEFYESVRV